MVEKQDVLAHCGLTLARDVLRRLDKVRIFAQPRVSLERQLLARRYVVRGIESGGAVREIVAASRPIRHPSYDSSPPSFSCGVTKNPTVSGCEQFRCAPRVGPLH
jgi:hypothetical protein